MSLRLLSVVLSALFVASCVLSAPGDQVQFINLPALNHNDNPQWGPVLKDIMNHLPPGSNDNYDDKVTLGHESSHDIASYIRNELNTTGKKANGFYVLNDQVAIVIEPSIRKSDVARFVPQSLQGSRYSTYVTGQGAWDDTPLYLWDEWNAYINGGAVGVDQVRIGKWNEPWTDGVSGVIEFVAYSLASGMAVKAGDPNYFGNYSQFREFLAWNLRRSMEVYKAGAVLSQFQWQTEDDYYSAMQHSADAEALRQFARDTFGKDWTQSVLGF